MESPSEPVALVPEPIVSDPIIGKVIDRYRVLEKIGEGGMGAVYRVEHVMLQKNMAMKLLRFELSQNQELVTRFQNEAIAASRIGQENIVTVTDFGRTTDGLVYFVMEELQGNPLSVEIHLHPRFSVQRTISVAAQVCRALHAAHNAGIVHRDLKPENIILTNREGFADFVKILDFGISKMNELADSNKDGARLTRAGMIVGTPEYMSPEQAAGKVVDARSDIYSLGVVLFEMLSGKLPFEADNPIAMLMRHQTAPVPAFGTVVSGLKVPHRLEKVVRRALAKQADERQQSMADLLTEIQECAESLELTQPALRLPSNSGPAPSSPSRPVDPRPLTPRPQTLPPRSVSAAVLPDSIIEARAAAEFRPRRRGLWIAGTAALLLIAGGGFVMLNGSHPKAVAQPPAPEVATPTPTPTEPPSQPSGLPDLPPVPPPEAEVAANPTPAPTPVAAPAPTPTPAPTVAAAKPPDVTARPHPGVAHTHRPSKPPPTKSSFEAPAPAPAAPSDPYQKVDELKKPY